MSKDDILKELSKRVNSLEIELQSIKNQINSLLSTDNKSTPSTIEIKRPVVENTESVSLQKPKRQIDIESLLGGNLIGKLGFVAIILATGWFINYAFDNQWINESGRILIGLLFGFLFMAWSMYLAKQKMKIIPEPMLGTGISILYISLYGAYYYYDFFSITETFLLFVFLSLATSLLAGKIKSEILYCFGMIGSLLTPVLLSSGENSYRFLFTYLTILNLVFVYISNQNSWKISPYILLLSNAVIYAGWYDKNFSVSNKYIILSFFLINLILFSYRELYQVIKLEKRITIPSLVFYAILISYFFSMSLSTVYSIHSGLQGHFILFLTAVLIIQNILFEKYSVPFVETISSLKPIRAFFLIAILSLNLISLVVYLEERVLSFALLFFAASFSVAGIQFKNKLYVSASLAIWFLFLMRLFFFECFYHEYRFYLLNPRFILFFLSSAILLFLYKIQKNEPVFPNIEIFAYASFFTLIVGSMVEVRYTISNYFYRHLGYSYVLAFYTIIFLFLGFKFNFQSFRRAGIVLAILVILKFYFYDIWTMSIVVRIIAGFSLGIGLVLFSMFYQKFKDKITMNQILKLMIYISLLFSIINPKSIYSDSFNPNVFKYKTKISPTKSIAEGTAYGKFKMSEEISRFHGMRDIRLYYKKQLLPYFISNAEESTGKSGETKPKIIFEEVTNSGRVYVIKLENIPSKSEYYELEIGSENSFESNVSISLGKSPEKWEEFTSSKVFKYSNDEIASSRIQFLPGNYRYARLMFDTKSKFDFLSANYRQTKTNLEYTTEIDIKTLNTSKDSDRNASIYYYENPEHKPIDRILIDFEDDKFERVYEVYERKTTSKEFISVATGVLSRKEKKEPISINLNSYSSGMVKILIENKDDEPLKLKSINLFSQMYEITFEIPNSFEDKEAIEVYYGNIYAQFPSFDIKATFPENPNTAQFKIDKHGENPNYTLSLTDPPASTYIIRIVFIIGFLLLLYPSYTILKKYKEEMI
jgi:hypothetical protein